MTHFLTASLLFLTLSLGAQNFTLKTSNAQPRQGEEFTISYVLENASPEEFIPPNFGKNFTRKFGPSQGSQASLINGRKSSSISYSYRIVANRTGRMNLPSAAVMVGGKRLTASGKTIRVLERGATPAAPEALGTKHSLALETNVDTAYVGQQILIDYVLYTTAARVAYDFTRLPPIDGAFEMGLGRYDKSVRADTIEEDIYSRKILKRVAVFPQQAGRLDLDAAQMRLSEETGRTIRRGFFPERETIVTMLETTARSIPVFPLPQPVPPDFSGVVDPEPRVQFQTDKRSLSTDEAVRITMTLYGESDVKRWEIPQIDFGEAFETYDPVVLGQTTQEDGGQLLSRKQIQYTLLPRRAGTYNLRPSVSYFDPDSSVYRSAAPHTIRLKVAPGSGAGNEPDTPEDASLSGPAPLFATTTLRPVRQFYFGSGLFWVLTLLPLFGLAGLLLYRRQQQQRSERDPGLVRRERARAEAERQLGVAKTRLDAGDLRGFYQEIGRATLGYVSDKLSIKNADLNTSDILAALQRRGIEELLVLRLKTMLQTTEAGRFAGPGAVQKAPETLYRELTQLLVELDGGLANN